MLIPFVWLYVFKYGVYTQLLVDQTQKDFWFFYMFLKVFLCFYAFRVFVHIAYFLFYLKTLLEEFSWEVSRISYSHENENGKNWKHQNLDRNFRDYLARNSYPRNNFNAFMAFSWVTLREAYPWKLHVFSF